MKSRPARSKVTWLGPAARSVRCPPDRVHAGQVELAGDGQNGAGISLGAGDRGRTLVLYFHTHPVSGRPAPTACRAGTSMASFVMHQDNLPDARALPTAFQAGRATRRDVLPRPVPPSPTTPHPSLRVAGRLRPAYPECPSGRGGHATAFRRPHGREFAGRRGGIPGPPVAPTRRSPRPDPAGSAAPPSSYWRSGY